jgi:tRNA modification GTPase
VAILARLEAAVDFIDEDGVAEEALSAIRPMTEALMDSMWGALAEYGRVRPIRDGVRVVLAGPPNAGKSSLLNRLAKREAAIVSPIPGTTRDAIEVMVDLAGMAVILTDTAGLRESTADAIEAIGMARSRSALEQADVVIWVTSPDCPAESPENASIHVRNKLDLIDSLPKLTDDESISVSAKTGEGFEVFVAALEREVAGKFGHYEHGSIVRERHRQAVADTVSALEKSLTVSGQQIELAAECVRSAARSLGRVTGKIDVEDLLDHIFREFCIGK